MTTLKHPNNPNPIEVSPDRVAIYAAAGWIVVEDVAEPAKVAPKRRRRPAPKK